MTQNINFKVKDLFKIYTKTKREIEEDFNSLENFDHVNAFWKNILSKRDNFPSFSDTLSFLSNNSAFGLGKRTEGEIEQERKSYGDAAMIINKPEYNTILSRVSESIIGFPKFFTDNGNIGSTSFTENMASTIRLIELIDKHLKTKDQINILEIGAGWGAVMHQILEYYGDRINKVAICDLHENLFISSFYLQSTFPERPVNYTPKEEKLSANDNSLNFCSPTRIQNLDITFDIVVNMISFQEMNIDVIDNYMSYIANHLAKGGVFYSENGIMIKGNVQRAAKASDYGYTTYFNLLELGNGTRFCPHLFWGNKHVVLLTNKTDSHKNLSSKHLDSLCYLMNLRLDENINTLKSNYINKTLSQEELFLLDSVYDFYATTNRKLKKEILDKMNTSGDTLLHDYLLSLYYISQRKFNSALTQLNTIEEKLEGLVKINVLCYIGILDKAKQLEILKQIQQLSPEMYSTAEDIFRTCKKSKMNMVEKTLLQLNMDVKTWFGYSKYQLQNIPSIIANRIISKLENYLSTVKRKTIVPYHLK